MLSLSVQNAPLLTSLEEDCRTQAKRAKELAERIKWKVDNHGYCRGGPAQLAVDVERGETAVCAAEDAAAQGLSKMKTQCEKQMR